MSDLIQRAINRIDEQAEKGKALEKRIGQYIIDTCLFNDADAAKALESGKTLAGCASLVTKNARKQAVGGCACVEDAVVWRWVRGYYGFSGSGGLQSTAQPQAAAKPVDILEFM